MEAAGRRRLWPRKGPYSRAEPWVASCTAPSVLSLCPAPLSRFPAGSGTFSYRLTQAGSEL